MICDFAAGIEVTDIEGLALKSSCASDGLLEGFIAKCTTASSLACAKIACESPPEYPVFSTLRR